MDMSYEAPDYNTPAPASKKQKTKTVYPAIELRGEAAIKFLKAHPKLKLGEQLDTSAALVVQGMKTATKKDNHVSDYDNCVTFELRTLDTGKESDFNDEEMPKD